MRSSARISSRGLTMGVPEGSYRDLDSLDRDDLRLVGTGLRLCLNSSTQRVMTS